MEMIKKILKGSSWHSPKTLKKIESRFNLSLNHELECLPSGKVASWNSGFEHCSVTYHNVNPWPLMPGLCGKMFISGNVLSCYDSLPLSLLPYHPLADSEIGEDYMHFACLYMWKASFQLLSIWSPLIHPRRLKTILVATCSTVR